MLLFILLLFKQTLLNHSIQFFSLYSINTSRLFFLCIRRTHFIFFNHPNLYFYKTPSTWTCKALFEMRTWKTDDPTNVKVGDDEETVVVETEVPMDADTRLEKEDQKDDCPGNESTLVEGDDILSICSVRLLPVWTCTSTRYRFAITVLWIIWWFMINQLLSDKYESYIKFKNFL